MKRTTVLVLATALLLNACIPLPFLGQPTVAPAVDVQATDAVLAVTREAETLNALPTSTPEPATDTPEPTATATIPPTATETATEPATETPTPDPNITATPTITLTGTIATLALIDVTATETLHPRFVGTLPPALPYGTVMLVNKSKAEAYISLYCTTIDGYTTIIEYPVSRRMAFFAPAGRYTYVAWVGGRQFQGSFRLSKGEDLIIVLEKDKVTIE